MNIKLFKTKDGYQTNQVFDTGIGRFQVYKTDNANARAIGRRPRWTVRDLYRPLGVRKTFDTLAEVKEWIAEQSK